MHREMKRTLFVQESPIENRLSSGSGAWGLAGKKGSGWPAFVSNEGLRPVGIQRLACGEQYHMQCERALESVITPVIVRHTLTVWTLSLA